MEQDVGIQHNGPEKSREYLPQRRNRGKDTDNHRLCFVHQVNQKIDTGIDQPNQNRKNSMAYKAADKIILFACFRMQKLYVVVEYHKKCRHNGQQPGVIAVA